MTKRLISVGAMPKKSRRAVREVLSGLLRISASCEKIDTEVEADYL